MSWRGLVASILVPAQLIMPLGVIAGPFEDGQRAARESLGAIGEALSAGSASAVIPGYTATPPEAALRGSGNLRSQGAARISACAATPENPSCAGLTAAAESASAPREPVSP
ncbi:MAG TPA: hypothetical protein PK177_10145, partial [Burkholderiaceae bacterium]|nr:hypothetical protein [Burkholderiaceae bacterium]